MFGVCFDATVRVWYSYLGFSCFSKYVRYILGIIQRIILCEKIFQKKFIENVRNA